MSSIAPIFAGQLPEELVTELEKTYIEQKGKFALLDYRASALAGGRLAEIVYRVIEYKLNGRYTPLSTPLPNVTNFLRGMEQQPASRLSESFRIQIPRATQTLYDIRNKRNIAHVGGDINPNYVDAHLSLSLSSWILSELVRVYYSVDINSAQKFVEQLVDYRTPVIQDFGGQLKILDPQLSGSNRILVLLYYLRGNGATREELVGWTKIRRQDFAAYSSFLENKKAYIHFDGKKFMITRTGITFLEKNVKLGGV